MKNNSWGKLIKRFLPYYKKYVPILIFDLFCASLTTVCEIVLPLIVRYITNTALTDIASLTISSILTVGGIYLVLKLIDAAANYYMASIGHIMGTKIETDMRTDMFDHLQKLSFKYYDNTKVGSLMSRMTSDLFDITEFAHHCPEELLIAGIKIICCFAILSSMNLWLTLIIFVALPPMIFVLSIFNKKMRSGFRESRKQVAELNSQIEDSLLGIRVVKSFTGEDLEKEKFQKGNKGYLSIKSKVYHYMAAFHCTTSVLDGVLYILAVVAGAIFIIYDGLNPADLIVFLMYITTLLNSIRKIVQFAEQFQRGMTGIERFGEIMETDPDIKDRENAVELEKVKGDIEFKNVTFKYTEETDDVLSHLNLKIPAGKNIALVGESGGGKTTICSLIPRFYEILDGSLTVDGVDIRDIKMRSLRSQIGVVQQDVYLFSGSVRENIEYGRPGASEDEIIAAAKMAGADEFINTLPDGYDTYVGERGVKLSGGQKQRISIARVFLKNPPILLLDEATSALDNESERLVQKSLERLSQGRTTLTIAHRLTTIKNADNIIVFGKSGIMETGTHDELLANGGTYADLYNTSFK